MNCENCGAELLAGAKFCTTCGQAAASDPLEPAEPGRPRFVTPQSAAHTPPPAVRPARPGAPRPPRDEPGEDLSDRSEFTRATSSTPPIPQPLPRPEAFADHSFPPLEGAPTGPAGPARTIGYVEPSNVLVVRIVAIYAAIGLGLAVAGVLMLWISGFFGLAASSGDLGSLIGASVIGTIALIFGLGVALLIGVVIASSVGLYAASRSDDRAAAVRTGAIGAAGGHLALALVFGVVLTLVISITVGFGGSGTDPFAAQRAECERVLGAGHPSCQSLETPDTGGGGIPLEAMAKLALGAIPTALTAGLVAGISFSRRSGHT